MTKKMQKKIEVFKLEERVLFDAAAAADIVAAMQNDPAVQNQQSEQDRQAQEEQNALKNAAPENASARAEEEALNGVAQPTTTEVVATADAAVQALVEGAIPATEVAEVEETAEGELTGEVTAVELTGEVADTDDDAVFVEAFQTPAVEAERELVIINSSIRDKDAFIDEAGKNADILILNPADDAMDQINEYLDAQDTKYSSVHVITHGNAGYFLLNGEVVTADTVANDPASWAAIGEHLTEDADIMLYSCNLTGNMEGQALAAQIANLTGADVAASGNITGNGGDWQFEYQLGVINHEYYKPANYDYRLATITVDSNGGGDYTSLGAAVADAQAGDEIVINYAGAENTALNVNTVTDISITVSYDVQSWYSLTITNLNATNNEVKISGFNDITIKNLDVDQATTISVSGDINLFNANGNAKELTTDARLELEGAVVKGLKSLHTNAVRADGVAVKNVIKADVEISGANNNITYKNVDITGDVYVSTGLSTEDQSLANIQNYLGMYTNPANAKVEATMNMYDVTVDGKIYVGSVGIAEYSYAQGKWTQSTVGHELTIQGDGFSVSGEVTNAQSADLVLIRFVDSSGNVISGNAGSVNNLFDQASQYIAVPGDVTFATYDWAYGDYNYVDNRYYLTGVISNAGTEGLSVNQLYSQDKLSIEAFNGTINVIGLTEDGTGKGAIQFNGDVVNVAKFNVLAGDITFGKGVDHIVAAAGGTFTIKGGYQNTVGNDTYNIDTNVTFNGRVYVSAVYNSTRSTDFRIEGGNVTFTQDLQNYVRSWRGSVVQATSTYKDIAPEGVNWGTNPMCQASGDFTTITVDTNDKPDAIEYKDLVLLWGSGDLSDTIGATAGNSHPYYGTNSVQFVNWDYGKYATTSAVNFVGGTVTFDSKATLRNY